MIKQLSFLPHCNWHILFYMLLKIFVWHIFFLSFIKFEQIFSKRLQLDLIKHSHFFCKQCSGLNLRATTEKMQGLKIIQKKLNTIRWFFGIFRFYLYAWTLYLFIEKYTYTHVGFSVWICKLQTKNIRLEIVKEYQTKHKYNEIDWILFHL